MAHSGALGAFVKEAEDALGNDATRVLEDVQGAISRLHVLRRREKYLASVSRFVAIRASLAASIGPLSKEHDGITGEDSALAALSELRALSVWPGTRLAAKKEALIAWAADAVHSGLRKRIHGALETLGYPKTAVSAADLSASHNLAAHTDLIAACAAMYRLSSIADSAKDGYSVHERVVGVLLEPVAVRFEFNFGDAAQRPTSRTDRPEWPLASALTTLRTHTPLFVDAAIDTSQLQAHESRLTTAAQAAASGTEVFTDAVVNLVAALFKSRARAMASDTHVLCRAVAEAARFDTAVRQLVPGTTACLLSSMLLVDGAMTTLCKAWVSAEGATAMAAFDAIEAEIRAGDDENSAAQAVDLQIKYTERLVDAALEIVRPSVESFLLATDPGLPGAVARCALLRDAIVPVLSALHARMSFAVPAGLGRSPVEDISLAAVQANAAAKIASVLAQWGESIGALETAASPEFEATFGYDASALEGTVFGKALAAFRDDLLNKRLLAERIEAPAWDAWATPLASFARAMHYGVRRAPGVLLAMHDDLRRANAALHDAIVRRAFALDPGMRKAVCARILARCDAFYADRVLLTNIYAGREATARAAADLAATRAALAEIAASCGVPADAAVLALSSEAVCVIDADDASVAALRAALASDDVAAATATVRTLGVRRLTLEHVEQIVSLIRDSY